MAPRYIIYIADLFSALHSDKAIAIFKKFACSTEVNYLKFYGEGSFQVAASRLWNSLTDDIRSIQNLQF